MLSRLAQLPLVTRVRNALRHDMDHALKPLRKDFRKLASDVEQLQQQLSETSTRAARAERQAAQLKWTLLLDASRRDAISGLDALLDPVAIAGHVTAAVDRAVIHEEPFAHAVIDRVLQDDVYAQLVDAIPPLAFFTDHDPIKQDLHVPMSFGPAFHTRIWNFVDSQIARNVIQPALLRKFDAQLQAYYETLFGPEFLDAANRLPYLPSGSRVMLRRPGYHLAPHRDPKRSLLTCLLYLAKPDDDEAHGTQLFRVIGDSEAHYKQTYYPEARGHRCELVKTVPFRPNSMLVFVNSHGAHGADIPADATQSERFSFQFYVAPENAALGALIRSLPPDRRIMWKGKGTDD